MLLAHSYPNRLKDLETKTGSGEKKSYAENITSVCEWIINVESSPDVADWRQRLFPLCRVMLQEKQYRRPKADDLRSWWTLQPSTKSCVTCHCNLVSEDLGHYSLDELNESLRRALENGHMLMVDFLQKRGAVLGASDFLVAASRGGLRDVVERLLRAGVDVEVKDNRGRTALHWAAGNGYRGVAQLILEHRADIKAKDKEGRTALHCAAEKETRTWCGFCWLEVPTSKLGTDMEDGGIEGGHVRTLGHSGAN